MLPLLPPELQGDVVSFLDAVSVKALHLVSREMRALTTGKARVEDYGKQLASTDRWEFHNWIGERLWRLEREQNSLHRAYREFKCRRKSPHSISRANHHTDFEVYDKCVRINLGWWCGHIFTELRGVMDSLADIDDVPVHIKGRPDTDTYYRRGDTMAVKPLDISTGSTFVREDLEVILGWLKRLHVISLEVEGWAKTISKGHTSVKRIRSVLEKRIRWLEGRL